MIENTHNLNAVNLCLLEIAELFENGDEPTSKHYDILAQDPDTGFILIEKLKCLDEEAVDENDTYYSACLFAIELCIAQLQMASENGNKRAERQLHQIMHKLAEAINQKQHTLGYWLPVLTGFYEAQVPLIEPLKIAYYALATEGDDDLEDADDISSINSGTVDDNDLSTHLSSMRDLLKSLAPMSTFDIAAHFFAQSYAMPPEFFADLMADLLELKEGVDVAVLMLLHPLPEVRAELLAMFDAYISSVILTQTSLTRLKLMKPWFTSKQQELFDGWIKVQRKKEVTFLPKSALWSITKIMATEVDGSGSQGIFFHLKNNRKVRLCGVLCKQDKGIKEAWITPDITQSELKQYYKDAFDDNIMLKEVDEAYVMQLIPHFLYETLNLGGMPGLSFFEFQEAVNMLFPVQKITLEDCIQTLSVQIQPFTPEVIEKSLKRSRHWMKTKRFVSSWFVESSQVDKIVNEYSGFENGIKVCRFEKACDTVLTDIFEHQRERWLFHFIWASFWLKTKTSAQSHTWEDCFIIAYLIYSGEPLSTIPLFYAMCSQSVVHSIDTMRDRQTHLHQA